MSFSKSKVSRFGSKPDSTMLTQRISATDFITRSRESSRSQPVKSGLISASFIDSNISKRDGTPKKNSTEGRARSKPLGKHTCYSSKIGRPNLQNLKKDSTKEKHETPEGLEGAPTASDSHTTLESTKSSPPNSKIPTVKSRAASTGNSRGSSYVGTPTIGSSHKSLEFQKKNLEMQFNMKIKRLMMMKKDLLEKQKPAIELYKVMLNLRNKIKDIDGKELPLEELKVVEYPEIKQMEDKEIEAYQEKLKDMKTKFYHLPTIFLDLSRKILDEKCEVLDKIFDDEGEWDQDELVKKIQTYKEESVKMEGQIESRLKEEEGKIRELIKDWCSSTKVNNNIDEELKIDSDGRVQELEQKLKQTLGDLQLEKVKRNKEFEKIRDLEREIVKLKEKLSEAIRSYEEEKLKSSNQKDRHLFLEQKLKSTKARMKDAELQKQELEMKVDELSSYLRNSEEEWKTKEIYLESRHKELQQSVQAHKEELDKLDRERHSVDVRADEIRAEFETKDQENQLKIQQLENELAEVRKEKERVEKDFNIFRVQSVNSDIFTQITNKKKTKVEDMTTSTELGLWEELQVTKSALKLAEDKIAVYAEEKNRFLDSIAENYKEEESSLNAISQLIQKEELISMLILQNKKLSEVLTETQNDLEESIIATKSLDDKNRMLSEQLLESDEETGKQLYELQAKLKYEIDRNQELEQQLGNRETSNGNVDEMIQDYENLLKIREGLLNMMQEKKQALEDQNKSLKDYIIQMRDQLNLLSIDKSKKEQELKTITLLLEEKTGYIDKIEERVEELEASVEEIKSKRNRIAESSALVAQPPTTRSRENLEEFINHVQTLYTQETNQCKRKIRSRMAVRHSYTSATGTMRNSNRIQSASCMLHSASAISNTSSRPKRTSTATATTVSDIIRQYRSTEGLDLHQINTSSTNSSN